MHTSPAAVMFHYDITKGADKTIINFKGWDEYCYNMRFVLMQTKIIAVKKYNSVLNSLGHRLHNVVKNLNYLFSSVLCK